MGNENAPLAAASPAPSNAPVWLIPPVLVALVLWGDPLTAIAVGAALSLIANRPLLKQASLYGKLSLQTAIVLLGVNLDARNMWQVSHDYAGFVAIYVLITFAWGLLLGRMLKVEGVLNRLISAGTAICGGTAIATLGPVIKARADQIALALGIVFFLNMIALIVFPLVGDALSMTQQQFGVWAALAVHDTSSVVATASVYGNEAAQVAATLKLGRTLWIIPLLLSFSVIMGRSGTKIRIPIFIGLFILASISGSLGRAYLSIPDVVYTSAQYASKALIVTALFFIGLEFTRDALKHLHGRVLWQALALWAVVVPLTLFIALHYA